MDLELSPTTLKQHLSHNVRPLNLLPNSKHSIAIERAWDAVRPRICERRPFLTTKDATIEALIDEFKKIAVERLDSSIESILVVYLSGSNSDCGQRRYHFRG